MLTQGQIDEYNAVGAMGKYCDQRPAPASACMRLPPATKQRSRFENQKGMRNRLLDIPVAARSMEAAQ